MLYYRNDSFYFYLMSSFPTDIGVKIITILIIALYYDIALSTYTFINRTTFRLKRCIHYRIIHNRASHKFRIISLLFKITVFRVSFIYTKTSMGNLQRSQQDN